MDGEGIAWGTDVQFEDALPKPTMAEIAAAACVLFDVTLADLKDHRRRKQRIARARQAGMAVTRKMTDHSYPSIGGVYNRDHTTVIFACNRWSRNELPEADQLYEFMVSEAFRAATAEAREARRLAAEQLRAEEVKRQAAKIEADSAAYWKRATGFFKPIIDTGRDQVLERERLQ